MSIFNRETSASESSITGQPSNNELLNTGEHFIQDGRLALGGVLGGGRKRLLKRRNRLRKLRRSSGS